MNSLKLSFLLLFAVALHAVAGTPPGLPDGWTDGYVYSNGVRLHFYQATSAPEKPVMIMVHGVTDIGLCWTTLAWKFEEDYNIYMLDARGHGLSDPFTSADDGETLVKDVVGFINAKGFENPIMIGHSMGAATVMRLGALYPDIPKAVIMLDPFLGRRGPPPAQVKKPKQEGSDQAEAKPKDASDSKQLKWRMMGTPEELIEQNNYDYDALVAKAQHDNPMWDLVDCQYWALSKKQYHGVYSQDTWKAMSGTMNTGDALARITAPALILKADAPEETQRANQEAAKVMQNGKLIHLEGTRHNLHHDDVERTESLIRDFLSNL